MKLGPAIERNLTRGELDTLHERRRQVTHERYTAEHDAGQRAGGLVKLAAFYLLHSLYKSVGGAAWAQSLAVAWAPEWLWFKPKAPRQCLVVAAALILAELDRIDRAEGRGLDQPPHPLGRPVVLESPYAGDVDHNVAYARRALRDSLMRGEAPLASHLLYTQPGVLDDLIPTQRAHGISAGQRWIEYAAALTVYVDNGISGGMATAIDRAEMLGVPVERRTLPEQER